MKKIITTMALLMTSGFSGYSLAATKADLVIHNANIYTVDQQRNVAQAVAVKGNKIIYVGNDAGVDKHVGYNTQLINAKKRLVLPGLHDVHLHPLEAGDESINCTLNFQETLNQHLNKISTCVNQAGNDWVLGWGHALTTLLEADKDPIEYLDQISTKIPIAIMESTSHSMWVNSAALAKVGFDKNSENPPGGALVKNANGELTGLLLDTAGDMVMHEAFAYPTSQDKNRQYQSLLWSLKQLKQNGITSISNARLYWKRGYLDAWKKADRNWQLTVRANMALWVYPEALNDASQVAKLNNMYSNEPNSFLKVNQIKMYSDGITINTTAAMFDDYLKDYGLNIGSNNGLNYFDQNRMTYYVSELEKTGFDMLIHAIGDRGVYESLNAIESAQQINGELGRERRHRLTHVEFVDPQDISRFERLNVTADFQVAGDWTLPGNHSHMETELLGPERLADQIPIGDMYNTGANVTLSSDWDVSSLSPFVGMMHSLQRGKQSLPHIHAAIEAYTINAAYSIGQENKVGSIEVGKLADFAIVDKNILNIPTDEIGTTQNLMTVLDGEVIYKNRQKW
mgnify:CR=1 FL=1